MTTAQLADVAALPATAELRSLHRLIDGLQGLAGRCPTTAYDEVLVELDRAARRIDAVKLQVVAAAETAQVAERGGLADTSSWVARRTQAGGAQAAADVRLATALAGSPEAEDRPCATALADGAVSAEHARVIVHATEQLPSSLTRREVWLVERELVERAGALSPAQLRRAARRALAVVEQDQAVLDRHEDTLLRAEEDSALARTRLTLHDNRDGTTSGHFTVPTLAAAILARAVHSMTSPRRAHLGAAAAQAGDPELRRDPAHQAGLALVELLEHLPTDRLTSKVAATVVVTIDRGRLVAELGAAGIDVGESLSAGDVRRLACGAGILTAIHDGPSLPLDLSRTNRLFTENQRVALATWHTTCAADGCERPFAWCELHHLDPWSRGGPTDLANAVPLCGYHHRRIHDRAFRHQHTSRGIVFERLRT